MNSSSEALSKAFLYIASLPIVLVRVTAMLDANLSLSAKTPLPHASFCPPKTHLARILPVLAVVDPAALT